MLRIAYTQAAYPIANTLDEDELVCASRFRFAHLREQYIFAHAFRRQVLSHYASHVSPLQWRFQKTKFGKPFVIDPIAFNLSHSEQSVALAVLPESSQSSLGVDVECFRTIVDLDSMIDFVCHDDEKKLLANSDLPSQDFLVLWTAKEALLKACGSGLIDDLKSINCHQSLLTEQSYLIGWQGECFRIVSHLLNWGVVSTAWSDDSFVNAVCFEDWASGVPVLSKQIHKNTNVAL